MGFVCRNLVPALKDLLRHSPLSRLTDHVTDHFFLVSFYRTLSCQEEPSHRQTPAMSQGESTRLLASVWRRIFQGEGAGDLPDQVQEAVRGGAGGQVLGHPQPEVSHSVNCLVISTDVSYYSTVNCQLRLSIDRCKLVFNCHLTMKLSIDRCKLSIQLSTVKWYWVMTGVI